MPEYRVRAIVFAVSLSFALAFAALPAQAQRFGKALVFTQIAFGGGYETVMNLTNRGRSAYNGTLTLRPSDPTKPFPALVNGSPLSAGTRMNLTLNPGNTASLRITSGDASAGTLSGFAQILSANVESDSLLEGNLTYYVKSADGTIVDSVGVAPSTQILGTVIPFDDFETVAIALANITNQTGTVRLTLFNDLNAQMGAATQPLASNQQVPKFLHQYFPGVRMTRGRVEIQSDGVFLGMALTYVKGGQASSLPFLPSVKLYDGTVNFPGETGTFHFYMSVEGFYVKAYTVDTQNGVPQPGSFDNLTGILQNGDLVLFGRGGDNDVVLVVIPAFSPSKPTQSGKLVVYLENPPGVFGQGTVTVTAVN